MDKEGFDEKVARYLGIAFVCGILWWIAYSSFYAPSTRENDPASMAEFYERLESVRTAVAASFPGGYARLTMLPSPAIFPRYELLKGSNLDIYLSKKEFQSVEFPDRSNAVARVGVAWCKQVGHTFMPAVRFRDIATGSVLASYGCILQRVSLSD